MKATLTIEVPDDFEKGNPKTCPYSKRVQHAWGNKDTYDCHAELTFIRKVRDCNEFNCPLEIQDDNYCPMNMECENCRGV